MKELARAAAIAVSSDTDDVQLLSVNYVLTNSLCVTGLWRQVDKSWQRELSAAQSCRARFSVHTVKILSDHCWLGTRTLLSCPSCKHWPKGSATGWSMDSWLLWWASMHCNQWRQSKRFSLTMRQYIYDVLQRIGDPILLAKNLRIMTNLEVWVSIYSPECDKTDGERLQACYGNFGVSSW